MTGGDKKMWLMEHVSSPCVSNFGGGGHEGERGFHAGSVQVTVCMC